MDGTVLIADDDQTIRTVLTQALGRAGCKVHATGSLTTLMRWVGEGRGDAIITDVMMPDGNGLEMLPRIAADRPGLPVIVISAQNSIMTAIRAAEAQAFDYLPKPFDLPDLMKRVARALDNPARAPSRAPDPLMPEPGEALPLIGRSPAMQQIYRLVARVVHTDLPVLVTGESGAGKSLVARMLHDLSCRRAHPFVAVAAPDLQGAGAPDRLLAQARGGTLLLDRIDDLPPDLQLRLVHLIDAGGAGAPRIVATAQTGPGADPAEPGPAEGPGGLRGDLYYRLAGAVIDLPPLRARTGDIALLAGHFLAQAAPEGGPRRQLSAEAVDILRGFDWPGNVRQLENTMRRLHLTALAPEITAAETAAALQTGPGAAPARGPAEAERLSQSVARHLRRYFDLHGTILPPPGLHARLLREIETPLIEIALDATGGNQARCAELLGINRNTLRKKITDLDIKVTRRRKMM